MINCKKIQIRQHQKEFYPKINLFNNLLNIFLLLRKLLQVDRQEKGRK